MWFCANFQVLLAGLQSNVGLSTSIDDVRLCVRPSFVHILINLCIERNATNTLFFQIFDPMAFIIMEQKENDYNKNYMYITSMLSFTLLRRQSAAFRLIICFPAIVFGNFLLFACSLKVLSYILHVGCLFVSLDLKQFHEQTYKGSDIFCIFSTPNHHATSTKPNCRRGTHCQLYLQSVRDTPPHLHMGTEGQSDQPPPAALPRTFHAPRQRSQDRPGQSQGRQQPVRLYCQQWLGRARPNRGLPQSLSIRQYER